jgi:hypothetical protein
MRLVERDYKILKEIHRWKTPLARHIKILADFTGQRATDRRLKILIENKLIDRKKILYGIPSIYTLTHAGKKLIGVNTRIDKIKIEQIIHDNTVLDTAIFFIKKYKIELNQIQTEKELHRIDGFSERKHQPDFIFSKKNKICSVEIELSEKAKQRLEKNLKENFKNYDMQYWILSESKIKLRKIIDYNNEKYGNIEIIKLEEVKKFVSDIK